METRKAKTIPEDSVAQVLIRPSTGWTVDTLHDYVFRVLDAAEALSRQRFQAQDLARNAIDERYSQRFIDGDKAVNAALAAAEKAVSAAQAGAEKAVNAAMTAAGLAVNKAEEAANKRFDCVSADTPILCADGTWRDAGELREGDELLAFDEEADAAGARQFRTATVTYHAVETDALLSVETSRGAVRCNARHPWLVYGPDGASRWVKAGDLKAGNRLALVGGERRQPGATGTILPLLYPVTAIQPAGVGLIASMSTSTRTYIAGGWASHNSVNEFRGSLADQANNMLPRVEAEQRFQALSDKIDLNAKTAAEKAEAYNTAFSARLSLVEQQQSARTGASQQMDASRSQNMTIVGLLIAGGAVLATVLTSALMKH